MKIAVCMKQVPAYSDGNMDEKTGLLIRSGLQTIVNPSDLSALETALRLKEESAEVSVFTMGPESAGQVIKEAFAMGADKGYLVSDRAFGGADVLSTAYTLMQALRSQDTYDLILCGRQTTDGDTGQVGGELARWIGIPHFMGVSALRKKEDSVLLFEQKFEDIIWKAETKMPCLMAVENDIYPIRMPSLKLRMAARKKEMGSITLSDFEDQDAGHYGLKGSATRVRKIFPPKTTKKQSVNYMQGREAAEYLTDLMKHICMERRDEIE